MLITPSRQNLNKIVIINPKGGCGKTTLATNLASYYAKQGPIPAVMDCQIGRLGYVIWYAALNYISAMQAALVQLSVPAIAAAGGVVLLAEPISARLLTAGVLILGGISLALIRKSLRAAHS